jgi:hypothetical protein
VSGFRMVEAIYRAEVFLSKLGLLRPFLKAGIRNLPATVYADSRGFQWPLIAAELQSAQTLGAIRDETMLMMEFGKDLLQEWGPLCLTELRELEQQLAELAGDVTVPSTNVSYGAMVVQRDRLREALRAKDVAGFALPKRWRELSVRCVSCRDYAYDPYEMFMTADVKRCYASEHAFLALYASDGKRHVFVNESHATGPFMGAPLYDIVEDMALALEASQNREVGTT